MLTEFVIVLCDIGGEILVTVLKGGYLFCVFVDLFKITLPFRTQRLTISPEDVVVANLFRGVTSVTNRFLLFDIVVVTVHIV